ncbi:Hypothetical predicted protein [Marmota monax]|uniref:BTB/POZ domain-containing adapter for CUL3-mediated RhoA degradation protein 2 n=1 Tax=Marmota monax TaxID=9995 RepID=A0A5E4AAV0_MARMO|nr:Hypothetical predicted protein [Marmota monax]
MSGDTCLCPASGAKPKLSGFKGGGLGNKYVQLNVGGSLYYTTVRALTRHDTMLKAMFSGRMEVLTDKEGWILIDRCGKHFGTILNYLRDDTITLPQNRQEIKELMAEAKYYLIQGLVNMCQTALQDKKDSYQPVCNIPIITSLREEDRLIESSTKPVVKLLYNRSNNKYSYTRGREIRVETFRTWHRTLLGYRGGNRKHALNRYHVKSMPSVFINIAPKPRGCPMTVFLSPRVPDNSLLEATSRSRSQASPSEDEEAYELRDRVRRIHVKRYSTYDDRQLGHQSAHRD